MEMYEIRRKNLNLLIAQYDGPTALARKLHHKGTSYISQLSKGRRPVTEKTAREIEKQLRLPKGWFDGPGDKAAAVAPIAVDMDLFTESVKAVTAELERQKRKLPAAKFAEVVAFVYQEKNKGTDVNVAALLKLAG